jgi:hypothetical protein
MTDPNPLALDRFTARFDIDNGHVVIADRDHTPLTGEVAGRILGDHEAAVIRNTSDRLGYIVFPVTDAGWDMAANLADQLNDLDAKADAAQADALIDSAAPVAERIEAADVLTDAQRRGIAAYRRAVEATPYQWSADCGERWTIGDRVRIGDPSDPYYHGVMVAIGLSDRAQGQCATVILADSPTCPLIVLLDNDEPVALPSPALYVRRAE